MPLGGLGSELSFDDEVTNVALIELRRFVIGFIEVDQSEMPRSGSGGAASSSDSSPANRQCYAVSVAVALALLSSARVGAGWPAGAPSVISG